MKLITKTSAATTVTTAASAAAYLFHRRMADENATALDVKEGAKLAGLAMAVGIGAGAGVRGVQAIIGLFKKKEPQVVQAAAQAVSETAEQVKDAADAVAQEANDAQQ
jgi:hypothetical protein